MKREILKEIIDTAATKSKCSTAVRKRLVDSVNNVSMIASGAFQINEGDVQCYCPATLAGYYFARPSGTIATKAEDFPTSLFTFPGNFDQLMLESDAARIVCGGVPDDETFYVKIED